MASAGGSERDLLFGLMALQLDFVERSRLVAALDAWAADRSQSLPERLVAAGALTAESRGLLESLVEAHLRQHGGDPARSLAALSAVTPVVQVVASSSNADVQTSLVELARGLRSTEARTPVSGEDPTPVYTLPDRATAVGTRLRVLRPHRRGGLGEVLLAEDEELGRRVALKQIRAEFADHPEHRARFNLEVEIAGNLQHPGIVPIYGLGAFPDGRPFYVMRFVEGSDADGETLNDAIKRFHDPETRLDSAQRELRLRRLLGRFIDVCEAIAYAHYKGVLHRDLKPSNILLGKYGETLLVDWGLAKATGRPDPARGDATEGPLRPQSGGSHTPTLAGQKMGTPAYMSPEQARGELERLGPATDVYSLGATLYCLLTGRPPVQGADDAVVTQHVIEGRIPAPRSVRSDLDPALDAICRQALANRPEDRYASALDLADDIERWLGDQPVTAYAEPWTRRLGRWARRHRTLVTTAGAVLGVLAAALAVGLWRVDQERQRTLRQFGSAHGLAASLVETAEKTLSQTPGQEALRKGLFDQAATSYDLLVAERRDDPALLREAGMVHFYKGNLLRFGNETDAADQEFQRARGLLDAARRLDPENLAVQDRLVELERDRAQLATRLGRDRQARASLEQALEAVGAVLQRDAANLDARRTEASLLASLVAAEVNLGQDAQALEHARTVVDRYRSLAQQGVDREKSTPAYATSTGERLVPLLYVMSLNRLADLQREGGKLDEALATSELAVARITPLVNAAKTPDNLSQTASTLRVRGEILAALLGREADARAAYDEALGILAALIQANGRSAAYREARGTTLRLRAELARRQNRADEARADLEASLADYDWLTKNAANIPRFWNGLGLTRAARAELLAAEGGEGASTARDQAITALRKAVSLAPDNVPFSRDLERVGGNGGRATGRKGTPPGP